MTDTAGTQDDTNKALYYLLLKMNPGMMKGSLNLRSLIIWGHELRCSLFEIQLLLLFKIYKY